jgi:hypothetical protein
MPPPGEDAEETQVMVPGDDGNEVKGLNTEEQILKSQLYSAVCVRAVLSVCV